MTLDAAILEQLSTIAFGTIAIAAVLVLAIHEVTNRSKR